MMTPSPQCRDERHSDCRSPICQCVCHFWQEYVPVLGWLTAADARRERRAYLDMDKAIERSHDDVGDM